ncbi:MAG: hypothetical protein ACREVS_18355, partial [Burkholderiales bacterium]
MPRSRREADAVDGLPAGPEFSLVRGDLPFRLQRRIGLIPAQGLGVGRRAVFFALVAWLPIVAWALLEGRALPGRTAEPLFEHFGIHARCLIAIPLFVLTEATAHAVGAQLVGNLFAYGLIREADRPRVRQILESVARLRDGTLPWVFLAGVVIAYLVAEPGAREVHALVWATDDPERSLPFGAWWFLYVARTIFLALVLAWLWRLTLWTIALARIARLDLALVPTHPDGVFGLGFLERSPEAFAPFLFGLSVVLASAWGHEVVYHGVDVHTLALPAGVFLVVATLVMIAPLVSFAPVLGRAKRRALAEYGALVARHGRLVRERWIEGKDPKDAGLLEAPEIGPVADTIALYEAVARARTVPIGKRTLIAILLPLAL